MGEVTVYVTDFVEGDELPEGVQVVELPPLRGLRWVGRNEDKPHRCPQCHAVATWDKRAYGPRTKLACPRECNVRWRAGNRVTREAAVRWSREESGGILPAWMPRFVDHSRFGRRVRGGRS